MGEPTPFGDRALRFELPSAAPRRRLFDVLRAIEGVRDVVLAEDVGCAIFDPATAPTAPSVARALAEVVSSTESDPPPARHEISVVYDGEDLPAIAAALATSTERVVAMHSERDYHVAMLGFLPGFGYLRGLAQPLMLPRRAPRPRVPPGSVAIAAQYTGIYPFASPGGWHLLGRAIGFVPFGPAGAALALGDLVRFHPAVGTPTPEPAPAPRVVPPAPAEPHLEITKMAGFALLVDGGRPGRMHEGVPPGGPLVRASLARANARAGNPLDACAIEVMGTIEVTAHGAAIVVADDAGATELRPGERFAVSTAGRSRVAYLAVSGGVDAPIVLGGRGALLAAGIGGLLRRGDRVAAGSATLLRPPAIVPPPELDAPIPILPGPDAVEALPFETMAKLSLRVSPASDRTGTRLDGFVPAPAGGREGARRSTPMVAGAIELTPSGLIVLGPDHPTTGGYPVVAVVPSSSLDGLFARSFGSHVTFRVG